ncbi:MAG: DNA mismatch repair protein MutS [Candidatus Stahlbacteria bacterium]|nr:DNA mismatch repair protein MutS [Candidatus Stahlbacteria bacterium]
MNLTPLLQQWTRIKSNYKDAILLFRLGDFYETFYEDAVLTSKVLGIALTKRQPGVPLAGIPHHSATPYIAKLTKAGYKVAICEQLEEPKPGKLVKRDVIEVITSGTILDEALLEGNKNHYLAGVLQENNKFGLGFIDLSTGDFKATELTKDELLDELKKILPTEIIIPETLTLEIGAMINITKREDYEFSYAFGFNELTGHFKVASLEGFGCQDLPLAIRAGGAVLAYIKTTKKKALTHIKPITPYFLTDYLILDEPTRKNLELIQRIGTKEGHGTLLWVLDHTQTSMGARMLRNVINFPLTKPKEIAARLDKVEEFIASPVVLENIREEVAKIPDLERLIAKISMERANPRDLKLLQQGLEVIPQINSIFSQMSTQLTNLTNEYKLPLFESTISIIKEAIVDNPPLTLQEGRIIRKGYNAELDQLHQLSMSGKQWISEFEANERKRTKITSLKVGFNNVFGYYIEVTRPNLKLVPQDYIRKQTLANAERFITEELKQYESQVLGAVERINRLEYELFCEVRKKIATELPQIQEVAQKVAEIDLLASFAWVARRNKYTRPEILSAENCILIKEGRHPVVEQILNEGEFVPNPTSMDESQEIYILTGPNMAGKSTYLRQVGLITLMAQMGSFVPASYAKIGIRDRIFTRIGASDDLARGVSTFLAEMNETANILNNATNRSLVLLDEIGRGTSTYDGMSIAWATVEYIFKTIGCKTLFATHYHELTTLNTMSSKIKNYYMSAKRYEDKIIFLRQLRPGGCDESYGIDVARLAGIPQEVINRAKEILDSMEKKEAKVSKQRIKSKQKILFDKKGLVPISQSEEANLSDNDGVAESIPAIAYEIIKQIKETDPDQLTPINALLLIKTLKSLLK